MLYFCTVIGPQIQDPESSEPTDEAAIGLSEEAKRLPVSAISLNRDAQKLQVDKGLGKSADKRYECLNTT